MGSLLSNDEILRQTVRGRVESEDRGEPNGGAMSRTGSKVRDDGGIGASERVEGSCSSSMRMSEGINGVRAGAPRMGRGIIILVEVTMCGFA